MSIPSSPLIPDMQVGFYYRLKNVKDIYLGEALRKTVDSISLTDINNELDSFVGEAELRRLASYGLRGELLFPIPTILKATPQLLGYYRLLLGFSQKTFFNSKGNCFARFEAMEKHNRIPKGVDGQIEDLCRSLIASATFLLKELDDFSTNIIHDLQLLTIGPQFRGSVNNTLGQYATQKVFNIIKEMVEGYMISHDESTIIIRNSASRVVNINFGSDPDIAVFEEMPSGSRGVLSVEIKGGTDISNIHNRIGEAEKSHQKARGEGFREFVTIVGVDIDYSMLEKESPTTRHFFFLDNLTDPIHEEYRGFKDLMLSVLSLPND